MTVTTASLRTHTAHLAIALVLAVTGQAAVAQTAPAAPAPEAAPATAEIVVTAQKRSERAVDVPISIVAVSGEKLASAGIRSSHDLVQVVPSLHIDQDGSYTQPTIRGIGNSVSGPGSNGAVAVYIDGFYQPSLVANDFDLVGIASIQVLKGPQGTLFGRNATGGAVQITTRDPSLTKASVDGTISYGSYNDVRATGYVSVPIGETLAINFAGLYHRNDGFVTNDFTGKDAARENKYTLRGKILWQPSDNFSALLTINHFHNRDDNSVAYSSFPNAIAPIPADPAQGLAANPNPTNNIVPVLAPGTIVTTARGHTRTDGPNFFTIHGTNGGLKLSAKLGDFANVTSYTQYRREHATETIDFDATSTPVYDATFGIFENTFTQEINIASAGHSRLTWLIGGYYYWDHSGNVPYIQSVGGGPNELVFNATQRNKAYAGFVDVTYQLFDRLFVTGGYRYTSEDQEGYSYIPGRAPLPTTRVGRQSFTASTPRAVLRYNLATNTNVYASFAKGFKAGGFSPTDPSSQPGDATGTTINAYKPEKITAYELGFKTRQGPLSVEAALFHNQYRDQQVAFYTNGVGHILNAASSNSTGFELQVNATLMHGLEVGLGGAYIHARYGSFQNSSAQSLSATIPPFTSNPTVDASGKQVQRSPTFTGNANVTYTTMIGNGKLVLNANYYRTSRFSFEPTHTYNQKAYGILNARAGYTFPGEHFTVSVYGTNITDKSYVSAILPFNTAILSEYGRPSEFGGELAFHF